MPANALNSAHFPLHDRHSRRRPYVAQAQNRGSVSNHRYRISLSGIRIRQALVSLDLQAGFRYPPAYRRWPTPPCW